MPLRYMDCSGFCYNSSRSLSFICVRELSHECSINFQVSVTSVNILSNFLLQTRFAYEKKREIYKFFLIHLWACMRVCVLLFIIYIPKQCCGLSTGICWITVMFTLGALGSALAERTYCTDFWGGVTHCNGQHFNCCVWFATHTFLHSPEVFHLLVVFLFPRKRTLVIKPDEELLKSHFICVGYYFFIEGKEK